MLEVVNCGSVFDKFLDGFVRNAYVGAEFLDGKELVGRFVQGFLDGVDQAPAIALALSGDALDVFWINAEAGDPGFHECLFISTNFGIMLL